MIAVQERPAGRPARGERGARLPLVIAGLAVMAAFVPGEWLELRRHDLDPWRMLTCHLTHFSHEQLAWDVLAFTALAVASARRDRRAFHATLLASALLVPVAVLAFAPDIGTYRGLSGLASAMFALLLTLEWRRLTWPVIVFATAFAAKLIFEAFTGGAVFVSDIVAVPVAHLAGAMIGVIGGLQKKRLVLLAPLALTSCMSLDMPLPLPRLDETTCNAAKDLLGNWRSRRLTQLGPASVNLNLGDDCRFTMRIQLLFGDITEQGRYAVEGDRLRLIRNNKTETAWPIRRDPKGRLVVQEDRNEWHTYTRQACASFWPCRTTK